MGAGNVARAHLLAPEAPLADLTADWEMCWWLSGYRSVCGVDEVGRGALAGPLVAAAVQLDRAPTSSVQLAQVADSKTLDRAARERLSVLIHDVAAGIGVGEVSAAEIDEMGLGPANRLAMLRAVAALAIEPEVLLLDAMTLDIGLPQVGLIDGDARCLSIAAASIVAKVHRDRLMEDLGQTFGGYGFQRHVGYGTPAHLRAIEELGPCLAHRRSFAPVRRCLPA